MKPDIPIIGQRSNSNELVSIGLFEREIEARIANTKAWDDRRKIHELRKSCGIEDEIRFTVNVRKPPRYRNQF